MSLPRDVLSRPRVTLPLVAAALVWTVYGRTLHFGFYWDDYHMVRPWALAEVRRALTGSWDPTRLEAVFYRPLAAAWYALRFELFGLNAVPQHALSIAGMAIAAWLAGLFVLRETGRPRAALIAAAVYAAHPGFVYSQGVWLTNQMHLCSSLTVMLALLLWQRVRARPVAAWWPLAVLQIVAFGFKEDTILLTPVIVMLTLLRAWLIRDVRAPRASVFLGGAALVSGLMFARYQMLGKLGGYGTVSEDRAWFNFKRGLDAIFRMAPGRLVAGDRPWHPVARAVSEVVLAAGALSALLRRRGILLYLFLSGVAIGVAFDLPFALVTKAEQLHLVTLGAVIALAAGAEALIDAADRRLWRWTAGAAVIAGVLSFVPLDWQIVDEFAPCHDSTLGKDGLVYTWWVVPEEIKAWLRTKRAECDADARPAPLAEAVTTVTWTYDSEDAGGERVRWTPAHAPMLVAWHAAEIQLAVRQPYATAADPVTVTIRGPVTSVTDTLTSAEWRFHTIVLRPTWRDRLRAMHAVDIDAAPTFVPGLRDWANPDNRRHGVEFKVIAVR